MNRTPEPTVFVVEHDPLFRHATSSLLASVGHSLQAFESAEEFDIRHIKGEFGCLLLDVRLPGMGGLQYQQKLLADHDPLPLIFVTRHGDISMAVRAMRAGAVDFLTKPIREQELLDAVQTALQRDLVRYQEEEELTRLKNSYHLLTAREREIMAFVVSGMLNKQIAAAMSLSEVTVKVHRSQVMHKMGAPSLPALVRMADRIGNAASEPSKVSYGQF